MTLRDLQPYLQLRKDKNKDNEEKVANKVTGYLNEHQNLNSSVTTFAQTRTHILTLQVWIKTLICHQFHVHPRHKEKMKNNTFASSNCLRDSSSFLLSSSRAAFLASSSCKWRASASSMAFISFSLSAANDARYSSSCIHQTMHAFCIMFMTQEMKFFSPSQSPNVKPAVHGSSAELVKKVMENEELVEEDSDSHFA